MFDTARATNSCTEQVPHVWSTDDAYHRYDASYNFHEELKPLQDYEIVNLEDVEGEYYRRECKNGDMFEGKETTKVDYSHQGVLVVDEDEDRGYCPICGAELQGGY